MFTLELSSGVRGVKGCLAGNAGREAESVHSSLLADKVVTVSGYTLPDF